MLSRKGAELIPYCVLQLLYDAFFPLQNPLSYCLIINFIPLVFDGILKSCRFVNSSCRPRTQVLFTVTITQSSDIFSLGCFLCATKYN